MDTIIYNPKCSQNGHKNLKEKLMNELKAIIKNSGFKVVYIAAQLNISPAAFYNKLNGKQQFNAVEISELKSLLHLSLEQVDRIFL